MTSRVFTAAWLVFVWLALTADTSVVSGLTAAALAVLLLRLFRPAEATRRGGRFRPLHAASVALYFVFQFLEANLQVAFAVLQPGRVRHSRGIVAVQIADATEITARLLAMAVSLTPGTFILELQRKPSVMFVHVLQFDSVDRVRLDVLEMERRIVKAFGPPEALREVAALMDDVHAGRLRPSESASR